MTFRIVILLLNDRNKDIIIIIIILQDAIDLNRLVPL